MQLWPEVEPNQKRMFAKEFQCVVSGVVVASTVCISAIHTISWPSNTTPVHSAALPDDFEGGGAENTISLKSAE